MVYVLRVVVRADDSHGGQQLTMFALITCATNSGDGVHKNLKPYNMKVQPITRAFGHAFNGLGHFFIRDRNGKIHLMAGIMVLLAGWYFAISTAEWCIILLCTAVVLSLEMLNYAIENLCNLVHSEYHPLVKTTKDVSAAAVLWSALLSLVIGLVIFIPKIIIAL